MCLFVFYLNVFRLANKIKTLLQSESRLNGIFFSLDQRAGEQNSLKLGMFPHRLFTDAINNLFSLHKINIELKHYSASLCCLQVNARNAERALNQEKLESSKLREK